MVLIDPCCDAMIFAVRAQLEQISASGYKSFRHLNLLLAPINVLVGANGSGKSSFHSMLKMFSQMMKGELQLHIAQAGGADYILH